MGVKQKIVASIVRRRDECNQRDIFVLRCSHPVLNGIPLGDEVNAAVAAFRQWNAARVAQGNPHIDVPLAVGF
jgi:hypothetical protein